MSWLRQDPYVVLGPSEFLEIAPAIVAKKTGVDLKGNRELIFFCGEDNETWSFDKAAYIAGDINCVCI
jgi:hypothetical protein